MSKLSGSLAVVTGAGSGIGRALALELVVRRAEVALCDINPTTLAATVAATRERAPDAVVSSMALDVTDRVALDEFAELVRIEHATESIDLLFNNAGVGGGESFVTGDEGEWDRTFDICWNGVYRTTRAFLPMLLAARSSNIVNISSINAVWAELDGRSSVSAYATAKFAVKGFTESLQSDLVVNAPSVRATLVMPGSVGSAIATNTRSLHGRTTSQLSPHQLQERRDALRRRGIDIAEFDDERVRQMLDADDMRFEDAALLTPTQAATQILDGVVAGRWRIIVGADATGIDRLARLLPQRLYRLEPARLRLLVLALAPVRLVRVLAPKVPGYLRRR